MEILTVISGGSVYISDPKFFAQRTDFFYHFPLWDFELSFRGKFGTLQAETGAISSILGLKNHLDKSHVHQ